MKPIDAAEELWRRIVASVERSIGNASRVAVLAGGGVDSSALLSAAIAVSRGAKPADVRAIALHYGGEGDDRPYLRDLERALGIVAVRVEPKEFGPFVRPLLEFHGAPLWPATAATDFGLMHRAKELGAEVVLSGVGGDEMFDGDPRALSTAFVHGDAGAVVRAARLRVPWTSTPLSRIEDFIFRPLVAPWIPDALQRVRRRRLHRARWSGWGGPTVLRLIDDESETWRRDDMSSPNGRYRALSESSHIADAVEFCATIAHLAKIRIAHPFLDETTLQLISCLPPETLLHGGRARGLFRLASRGSVPDRVRLRPDKAHFTLAQRDLFQAIGGLKALSDLLTMEKSAAVGLVDARRFSSVIRKFERDVKDDEAHWVIWSALWPALSVEGFLRARAALS